MGQKPVWYGHGGAAILSIIANSERFDVLSKSNSGIDSETYNKTFTAGHTGKISLILIHICSIARITFCINLIIKWLPYQSQRNNSNSSVSTRHECPQNIEKYPISLHCSFQSHSHALYSQDL